MILRIEDTDAERNKPELVEGIIDGAGRGLASIGTKAPSTSPSAPRSTTKPDETSRQRHAFLCYCPAEKYAGGDHAPDGAAGDAKASQGSRPAASRAALAATETLDARR